MALWCLIHQLARSIASGDFKTQNKFDHRSRLLGFKGCSRVVS